MPHHQNLDSSCLVHCVVGQALDGMCVGLVITNAAGRVQWLNRSAQRILGLDVEETTGQLLSHALRDPNMAEFWHQAATDEVVMGEVSLHWPVQRELKANAAPCQDGDGQTIARALLFCDVTAERAVQVSLSREATERLMQMADQWQNGEEEPHAGLTAQELRILRLVGAGLGNEEIAKEIHIAPSTVRTHLKHLYAKLGLPSRSEAISYAIRHGLVQ